MAIAWKWTGKGSISRSLETEALLSSGDDEYAGSYLYDETEPARTMEFTARGLTWQQVDSWIGFSMQRHYEASITEIVSNALWTGRIVDLSWERITGTALWQITLVLRLLPTEPEDL